MDSSEPETLRIDTGEQRALAPRREAADEPKELSADEVETVDLASRVAKKSADVGSETTAVIEVDEATTARITAATTNGGHARAEK